MPRPAYNPSDEERETVKLMAAAGIPQARIASVKGIDEKTLRKHFRQELDHGADETLTAVADSLVRKALAGDTTAAIFYLKTRGKWSERNQLEVSGPDGGSIKTETTFDPSGLSDAALAELMAAKKKGG